MSFVKTAVKKVFSFVKKVVKSKVFKWVAIAALTFFTAGVAAGGFAAFTGVTGVGTFFTAVGQTIATGAASMASTLGFQGVSGSLASHGGAAAIQAGLTTTATSASGAALTADVLSGTIAGTGTAEAGALALSAKGTAFATAEAGATLLANPAFVAEAGLTTATQLEAATAALTTGAAKTGISSTVWKGIQVGFSAMAASQANKKQKKGATFVMGGLSKGPKDRSFGASPSFVVGGPRGSNAIKRETAAPQADVGPTLAGELARRDTSEGVAALPQQPSGVLAADPRAVQDIGGVQDQAGVAPQEAGALLAQTPSQQGVDQFLGEFKPTSILSPNRKQSIVDNLINNRGALGV